MPMQRYALKEASSALKKFVSQDKVGKQLSNSMQKHFGSHWAVFVDQPENNRIVKRTCDMDKYMMFELNRVDFILCQIMR